MSFKVKVAIKQLSDRSGYIVSTDDGREFIVKNIDEAIKLKNELDKEDNNDLPNIRRERA